MKSLYGIFSSVCLFTKRFSEPPILFLLCFFLTAACAKMFDTSRLETDVRFVLTGYLAAAQGTAIPETVKVETPRDGKIGI